MCDESESKPKWVYKLNIVAWSFVGKDYFVVWLLHDFHLWCRVSDLNERHYLLIHPKELEQFKKIWA